MSGVMCRISILTALPETRFRRSYRSLTGIITGNGLFWSTVRRSPGSSVGGDVEARLAASRRAHGRYGHCRSNRNQATPIEGVFYRPKSCSGRFLRSMPTQKAVDDGKTSAEEHRRKHIS